MRKTLATIYAVFCSLLLVAGFVLVFYFSWQEGTSATARGLVGLALGFLLAPIVHELGHIAFAYFVGMDCVYAKFFCFKIYIQNNEKKFGFASPVAPDQTQVLPKKGGNMPKRAALYSLGGLIFGGVFFMLTLVSAVLVACIDSPSYLLFGVCVYSGYLFLLNVMPFEYPSGKTDALVYQGIKKGSDAEVCMLFAMEIQGQLYEGKSYSEIARKYYFDLPQLCEDEPMYAVMLDLRYRYYIEKGDFDRAADCLNRLARNEAYLTVAEVESIAAELVYLHSLNGDLVSAELSSKACRTYLQEDIASAKRILAAYSSAGGKVEAVPILLEQARVALKKERVAGVRKFEEILLSRISVE